MEKKLLRAEEVAEILCVSKAYVYRLMSIGAIPTIRMGDRAIRVRSEDLDIFILNKLSKHEDFPAGEKEKNFPDSSIKY